MHSRLCSSLELLEARIAPAGIVKVTVAGGSVKIVGDALDNDISLSLVAAGDLQIVGNANTQIDFNGSVGGSASVENYGKDLTVSLGAGRDRITLAAASYYGSITLDGGADDNTFTFNGGSPIVIPGSLKILGKAGTDTVNVGGAGQDFRIGRDFLVALGEGGAEFDLAATRALIGGKLTLLGGSGVEDFSWNVSGEIAVGGDLTISSGKDLDRIGIRAGSDLGITGKLTIKGGDSIFTSAMAIVAASLGVTAGDEMTVRGLVSATTLAGESVLSLGGTTSTNFASGLSIKTGKGHSDVILQGAQQTYLGKVAIAAGGATDFTMKPASFFIGGDFSFKGSAATDFFDLESTGIITGKATIDLGAGAAQTLTFTAPGGAFTSVFGDVTLKQGGKTGTSTTTVAGLNAFKKFTLATGAAADTVTLDNLNVRGATGLALGAGGDLLRLETTVATGPSTFGVGFKVLMGEGDDQVTIGVAGQTNSRIILDILNAIQDPGLEGTIDLGGGSDGLSGFAADGTATNGNLGRVLLLGADM